MNPPPTIKNQASNIKLRRCILMTLYHFFTVHPYSTMELSQLSNACEADAKKLNWNIVYLEKCGYVEIIGASECLPYIACGASISFLGVDLVEDEFAFNDKFPVSAKPDGKGCGNK